MGPSQISDQNQYFVIKQHGRSSKFDGFHKTVTYSTYFPISWNGFD